MKCILRSDIPPRCEVHKMTCTLHSEIRYTPHQMWSAKMTCTLHSEIRYTPQIWTAHDDMYIALWDQIYPPKMSSAQMTCACISHMHALCTFRYTPLAQLDSGMKYQLIFWDEVYRLWYFNDHITTLDISEKNTVWYLPGIQGD